eukprot:2087980-Prymnesium_polylepis.1
MVRPHRIKLGSPHGGPRGVTWSHVRVARAHLRRSTRGRWRWCRARRRARLRGSARCSGATAPEA